MLRNDQIYNSSTDNIEEQQYQNLYKNENTLKVKLKKNINLKKNSLKKFYKKNKKIMNKKSKKKKKTKITTHKILIII